MGGGTPGLLSADQLSELCKMIGSLDHEAGIEWSIELAPSEINPEKLEVLRKGGVNRMSLGVQTFDPRFMDARPAAGIPLKKSFRHINVSGKWALPRLISICSLVLLVNQLRTGRMILSRQSNLSPITSVLTASLLRRIRQCTFALRRKSTN